MNKIIIGFGGLIFGAGVGAGVTYILLKKKYDKEADQREIELQEYFKDKFLGNEETTPQEEAEEEKIRYGGFVPMDKLFEDRKESYTDKMNRRKEELFNPNRVQYETFSSKENRENENDIHREIVDRGIVELEKGDEEKDVDVELLKNNNDNPRDDIFCIDSEQFAYGEPSYDKLTLYWWELERILSEEDMDILDVPDILGFDWENHIGEFEKDIVYVRNRNMQADYEVRVMHESFYRMRDGDQRNGE